MLKGPGCERRCQARRAPITLERKEEPFCSLSDFSKGGDCVVQSSLALVKLRNQPRR